MQALVLEVPISLFVICIIPAKNLSRKTNIIQYHSTWPANNCLQIMVCSCAMSSNCVWLQIIFCLMRERNHAWYVIAWKKADRFASRRYSLKNKLGDPMIKQLWNSVTTTYGDLPVSRTSIICLSLRLRQLIGLLAAGKWRYFAQPRPIIVNYLETFNSRCGVVMATEFWQPCFSVCLFHINTVTC